MYLFTIVTLMFTFKFFFGIFLRVRFVPRFRFPFFIFPFGFCQSWFAIRFPFLITFFLFFCSFFIIFVRFFFRISDTFGFLGPFAFTVFIVFLLQFYLLLQPISWPSYCKVQFLQRKFIWIWYRDFQFFQDR